MSSITVPVCPRCSRQKYLRGETRLVCKGSYITEGGVSGIVHRGSMSRDTLERKKKKKQKQKKKKKKKKDSVCV